MKCGPSLNLLPLVILVLSSYINNAALIEKSKADEVLKIREKRDSEEDCLYGECDFFQYECHYGECLESFYENQRSLRLPRMRKSGMIQEKLSFDVLMLDNEQPFCRGSLIHRQWVLSAGCCIRPYGNITILLEDNRNVEIHQIVVHPDFNKTTKVNNLLLLKLSKPVGNNISIAKVSAKQIERSICIVSGCQRSSFISFNLTEDKCQNIGDQLNPASLYVNHPALPCQDDMGYPLLGSSLVCNEHIEGVYSFEMISRSNKSCAAFTCLTDYYPWIVSTIE